MLPTEVDVLQIERFDCKGLPALTLYLDTEPTRGPGRNVRAQLDSVLRPITASLEDDPANAERLLAAGEIALAKIAALKSVPRAVAVFVCPDLGFLHVIRLPETMGQSAYWGPELHLKPLLGALDEHERSMVVLVDRAQAHVFRVFMGEIEEVAHFTEEEPKHGQAGAAQQKLIGGNHGSAIRMAYGERNRQRAHEWHVHKHMARVRAVLRFHGSPAAPVDRVFLGGGDETVYEFLRLLPRRIRDRTRLMTGIPVDASRATVLARVIEVQREAEREEEEELVDNLTERDRGRSVFGATAVSEAVSDARVHTLVYASDMEMAGGECTGCGWLMPIPAVGSCPRCGGELYGLAGLVERLVSRVIQAGGRVEEVRGPAGKTLRKSEGLAALLRYVPGQAGALPSRLGSIAALALAAVMFAAPLHAQTSATSTSASPRVPAIQNLRPADQRGLHFFESPKNDGIPYAGFRLAWGGAFTQQFQSISHENAASPLIVDDVDANALADIGAGFNNATANLDLNVQLADGVRVALTTYLSSRHHNEAWVKDGYLLLDASPIDVRALNQVMELLTLKIGHFEIDYGDAHYRRSDNGNAMYNPFVGNLLMDAFTTQIGAHVYARKSGFLAMAGITGGEIKGEIRFPEQRGPAYLAKLGLDRQVTPRVRVRLTGSYFTQNKGLNNTLYLGDRAGSRYYLVLENTSATATAQAWSGEINPLFKNHVTAAMLNPFVRVGGLELFGTLERAKGRASSEAEARTWTQYAGEAVYRFLAQDALYVGTRYNKARGALPGIPNDVSADRLQVGAGWFLTPNVLMKGEWVKQHYNGFPTEDIRHGGRFDGFVIEGVVAF